MKQWIPILMIAIVTLGLPVAARAEVGLNIRGGGAWNAWDSSSGSQEAPAGLLHLAVGYRPIKFLNLGVDSHFDVVDNDADMLRIAAFGRVEIPITFIRIFGGAGLGYWNKDAIDGDAPFDDQGFTYNFDVGVDFTFLKFFGVSVYGSFLFNKSEHHDRNDSYPEWVKNFLLGLDVIVQF